MGPRVTGGRARVRCRVWLIASWLLLLPHVSHAQEVIDFRSDGTWSTLDSGGQPVGPAMLVCLSDIVPGACPPGATSWQWPDFASYPTFSEIPGARWIWGPGNTSASPSNLATYTFTRTFTLTGAPLGGTVYMTADDRVELYVNGALAGAVGSVQVADTWPLTAFDILPRLVPGQNTITFVARNGPTSFGRGFDNYSNNPAGVIFGGRITVGTTGAPGAPTSFAVTASDFSARFSWRPPVNGGTPTGYTLLARQTPGGPVTGSLSVGNALALAVDQIPPGVYFVSVQGSNASGPGAESNLVALTVPAPTQLPGPPVDLVSDIGGSTLTLSWSPPLSGGLPSAYLLEAGVTPWFTTAIGTATVVAPVTSLTVPNVPPGVYYLRVAALNGAGRGARSAELTVNVGGAALPAVPSFTTAQVVANTVTIAWAAGIGVVPTHYLLAASSTPDGPLSAPVTVTGTSLVVTNVPPGTYTLFVRAATVAGASSPSPPLLVVVP